MPSLARGQELRNERAKLAERMKELLIEPAGENGALSDEQETEWKRLHERQESLRAEIDRIEEHEDRASYVADIERELSRSQGRSDATRLTTEEIDREVEDRAGGDNQEAVNAAFEAWIRYGSAQLTKDERSLLVGRAVNGRPDLPAERRAMGVGQDSKGGFLVAPGFRATIIEALKQFGGMRRSRAFVFSTERGEALSIPTDNDTTNEGRLVGEAPSLTETDVTIGQVQMNAYTYSSDIVKVNFELLQDSEFDVGSYLSRKLSQRLGRIQNRHFTTGTGASQPEGVVVGATVGKTGANPTSVTVDELLDLKHAVDPDYRLMPEWMWNDSTLKELKQLKDGEGRPLWQPGFITREPDTFDGDPYVVNQEMASMAASAKPIAYGDFSLYYIRDVRDMSLLRLDERFADNHQVGFLAFMRADGKLIDAGTNPVQVFQNAAS